MAVQPDYEWITWRRVRVLRELAEFRSEREIAKTLGLKYNTVRGIVAEIKNNTGLADVREIGRWWRKEQSRWVY